MRWTLPAWVTMASSLVRMEMFRRGQLDIQDLVALCILQTTAPITLTSRFRAMARWRLARLQQTPGQSPPGLMKVRTARAISWPTMDGHWLLTMARHSNWNPGHLAMGSFIHGRGPTGNGRSVGASVTRLLRFWINGNIGRWYMTAPIFRFTAMEIPAPTGVSLRSPSRLHLEVTWVTRTGFLSDLNWHKPAIVLGTACWMTWRSSISRYPNPKSRRSWLVILMRSFRNLSCQSATVRGMLFSVGRRCSPRSSFNRLPL